MTTGKGPKKKLGEVLREVQAQIDAAMAPTRAIARQLLEDLGLEPEGTTTKPKIPRRRGRPPERIYDRAYQELESGVPFELVFRWYCQEAGCKEKERDEGFRENFRRAMKSREKRRR